MTHPDPKALICALSLCFGGTGCTVHTRTATAKPPVALPDTFDPGTPTTEAERHDARWWRRFGDAQLSEGIERALSGNLDLRQGRARIEQAAAVATQFGSARYPAVDGSAGIGRARSYDFLGQPRQISTYTASVSASYEVDLWGRIGALVDAADADVAAARYDLEALAIAIAASYAEAYFALAEQRALDALLKSQLAVVETRLDLVQIRFGHGLASAVDVLQLREQRSRLDAQLPLVGSRAALFESQLAVLSGLAPGRPYQTPDTLPELPPVPAAGLPAALLKQRPDARAAQARIAAQDHRVGAAIADRYPALRLTASVGTRAFNVSDLMDRWIWNLGANLLGPIFDAGRRKAVVARQRAALEERIAALGKVLIVAVSEVRNALIQERQQRAYLARLDERLHIGQGLVEETRNRYVEGVTDYLPVISAIQSLQATEQVRISAHRQLISYRIQLHRALGGDWTASGPVGEAP